MPIPLVDLTWQHSVIEPQVLPTLLDVMRRGAFIGGAAVEEFEADFARYCEVTHCVGVANGTDAIEIALRALHIGPGDEVIVPTNTFVATVEAVLRAGAIPRLVDCDDEYLLIDPRGVEAAISPRTRAVIAVHLYGQVAPMRDLAKIAEKHNLALIEDAAQCQGARLDGRRAGGLGHIAATSFYPGKNLGAYGDGGAVLTDDEGLARYARRLANHGSARKYHHPDIGFNSRLDALQAVILREKLRRLDDWNALRQEIAVYYSERLAEIDEVRVPTVRPGNEHVWHLYVIRIPRRDAALAALNRAGIGAAVHYPIPVHLQPGYVGLGYRAGDFPVAERAATQILSLPIFPGMTTSQCDVVIDTLREALTVGETSPGDGSPLAHETGAVR